MLLGSKAILKGDVRESMGNGGVGLSKILTMMGNSYSEEQISEISNCQEDVGVIVLVGDKASVDTWMKTQSIGSF